MMAEGIRAWSAGSLLFPRGLDGVVVVYPEGGLGLDSGEWGLACQSLLSGRGRGWGLGGSQKTKSNFPTPPTFLFLSLHQAGSQTVRTQEAGWHLAGTVPARAPKYGISDKNNHS